MKNIFVVLLCFTIKSTYCQNKNNSYYTDSLKQLQFIKSRLQIENEKALLIQKNIHVYYSELKKLTKDSVQPNSEKSKKISDLILNKNNSIKNILDSSQQGKFIQFRSEQRDSARVMRRYRITQDKIKKRLDAKSAKKQDH